MSNVEKQDMTIKKDVVHFAILRGLIVFHIDAICYASQKRKSRKK